MSIKPKISVIITTKNEEANIGNCLQSVKDQDYKNIEIIVVDNNSKDKTKQISKKYTRKVFNKGPERSSQRNFGASKATGVYYMFLDADMILTRKVMGECVQALRVKNTAGIVIPERSVGNSYWAKCKSLERQCYVGDSSIEAARFFDKKIFWDFKGYNEKITGPEDWDLPQRLSKKYKIGRIKSYIIHNEGKVNLITLMKKKYYYGLKVPNYLENDHPLTVTLQQVVYLLRPSFYKNWKLLIKNPVISIGMIVMLFLEQIAGFAGFLKGSIRR